MLQPLTCVPTNKNMKLYLMRHGEALSPQIDPERGLTDDGKLKVQLIAAHLKNLDVSFNNVFHSKKKRARETAEIMMNTLSPNAKLSLHQHISPEDDPSFIFSEIMAWDEDTLITSHLPFVPNLITLLTGKDAYLTKITFETSTVVCLEKNQDAWNITWSIAPSEI